MRSVNSKLEKTNEGIRLLYEQYAELARSIETGDVKIAQNIGNLVNQQKAVTEESNRHLQGIKNHLQKIESKFNPPAIGEIEALISLQSEMRIDELTEFMKNQYIDILKQCIKQRTICQH